MSLHLLLGVLALVLHVIGYAWYAREIFHGRTRPNAASWLMWLVGAWVEYVTFDAIDSHWATSALPLACFLGCCAIFIATAALQFVKWRSGVNGTVYHPARWPDCAAVSADLGAYAAYAATGGAAGANAFAVVTSIVSFVPIWRTTWRHGNEMPGPWLVWCGAYLAMLGAVLAGGGSERLAQSVYPAYYLLLTLAVAVLSLPAGALRRRPG